jgi:hypothetical protein
MPIIPALWRIRQEDHEASLGYIVRFCLKNIKSLQLSKTWSREGKGKP